VRSGSIRRALASLGASALFAIMPASTNAQLVQAMKVESNQIVTRIRESNAAALRRWMASINGGALEKEGERTLELGKDEDEFRESYESLRESLDPATREQFGIQEQPNDPAVLFALGYGGLLGSNQRPMHALGIETNVAGAGLGALFQGLGAEPLKKYLETNATVAAYLPSGRSDLPETRVALGLGALPIKGKVTLVPTLSFEEADSSDSRITRRVVRGEDNHRSWASPVLAMSFVLPNLPGVALSIGANFPVYYPGSALEALGKLFSFQGNGFRRAGRGALSVQVGIPLQRLPTQ
jgi:hypothetical protein